MKCLFFLKRNILKITKDILTDMMIEPFVPRMCTNLTSDTQRTEGERVGAWLEKGRDEKHRLAARKQS